MKYLKTSDIAKAVGVHPNTVRLYEDWGFLPAIPRGKNNYRLFSVVHLKQMKVSWTALRHTWIGGKIRESALRVIELSVGSRFNQALNEAHNHLELVRQERERAKRAAHIVEGWVQHKIEPRPDLRLQIGEAASMVEVSVDMLRNWERNGLLKVPRNPRNGYRIYGAEEINRLIIIRMLRLAGYSLMAILRMLNHVEEGQNKGLVTVLDTPNPEFDVGYVTDRWLTTLAEMEEYAHDLIKLLQDIEGE